MKPMKFSKEIHQSRMNQIDNFCRIAAQNDRAIAENLHISQYHAKKYLARMIEKGHLSVSDDNLYASTKTFFMEIEKKSSRNADEPRRHAPEIKPFRDNWLFCLHQSVA